MGLNVHKRLGPRTKERYLNTVGQAYINAGWQTATVLSVREHRGRVKLTVNYPSVVSPTEITLNLWRETPTGSIE